jgi:SAM-dependent methyltransferase
MSLPGIGEVSGSWDVRPTADAYLGGIDLEGKRCLDIGTASGYLAFEMERRGASEVVAVDADLANLDSRDFVPFARGKDLATRKSEREQLLRAMQRSFWLAHRALRSNVRVFYGSVYELPDELGRFDVVMLGMILPHLRDPLLALENATRLCRGTLVVTQQAPEIDDAYAYFLPRAGTDLDRVWWSMSDTCLERMLEIVGFEVVARSRAEHACPDRPDGNPARTEPCSTTVARRSSETAPLEL